MNNLATIGNPVSELVLFGESKHPGARHYLPILTAVENHKGVLDVDTVKGCTLGMKVRPEGGCYEECYAAKTAARYGIDFSVSVSRKLTPWNRINVFQVIKNFHASWYRIGTAGDPCHDWENTIEVIEAMHATGKQAVIITKHWITLSDDQIIRLGMLDACVNTSTSGLDTEQETKHRVRQINRLKSFGVESVNRVVTCDYGDTEWARPRKARQDYLLTITPMIDNPLRADKLNKHVVAGDIKLSRIEEAIGGGKFVSLHDPHVYLGTCALCPDQCGAKKVELLSVEPSTVLQTTMFEATKDVIGKDVVEWIWPTEGKVIGSFDDAKNKGFDISGKLGQDIFAASAGKVMYEGSGIRGYGNLVIIKHTNALLSAYAHNKVNLVNFNFIIDYKI